MVGNLRAFGNGQAGLVKIGQTWPQIFQKGEWIPGAVQPPIHGLYTAFNGRVVSLFKWDGQWRDGNNGTHPDLPIQAWEYDPNPPQRWTWEVPFE